MSKSINIIFNLTAIFVAVITVFNLQRDAPIEPKEYFAYACSFYAFLFLSMPILMLLLIVNNYNRVIRCSVYFVCVMFALIGLKALFKKMDHNAFWDSAAIGMAAILCYWKLGITYSIKGVTLIKSCINQFYMKWPLSLTRKRRQQ